MRNVVDCLNPLKKAVLRAAAMVFGLISLIVLTFNFALAGHSSGAKTTSRPVDLYEEASLLKNCSAGKAECFQKAKEFAARYKQRRSNRPFFVADEYRENVAILVHSYTMDPNEMQSWARILVAQGFNVFAPILEAHSDDGVSLRTVTSEDWQNDMRLALDVAHQFGKKIFILGYSIGGMLAIDTAIKYPNEIAALGTISPSVQIGLPLSGFSCVGRAIVEGSFVDWISRQLRGSRMSGYEIDFISGGCAIRNVLFDIEASLPYAMTPGAEGRYSESPDAHLKRVYEQIQVPIFIVYTWNDEILSSSAVKFFADSVVGPKTVIPFHTGVGHLSINDPSLTNEAGINVKNEFLKFLNRNFVTEAK